ncbi:hypothetical protein SAMN05444410_101616 [Hydrobacter penzbergensis]|uniref:Uncharacterized protein n=1 Tax=Hydrobacter penzbergensis TaxID=1235997 RepID=A0A8X8LA87_9BACT|nr:hypothetical protein SAMN05444410_101616 [Hydrobacter penzbergensis]
MQLQKLPLILMVGIIQAEGSFQDVPMELDFDNSCFIVYFLRI